MFTTFFFLLLFFYATKWQWRYLTEISQSMSITSGALEDCLSWPLGPCFRDAKPNWAAHGSKMWVTENGNAENKTCFCNDGGGSTRTYWQEDMIQSPGLFFFFFLPPSPFQQTPDGHPAGMTISPHTFWQTLIPCSFPSLSKKRKKEKRIKI